MKNYQHHVPTLAIIQVGSNPASESYVKFKKRDCDEVGIAVCHAGLDNSATVSLLKSVIHDFNDNPNVDGIIVQLPLPDRMKPWTRSILNEIDPAKDVDGFTGESIARLSTGLRGLWPCTPHGIIHLLKHNQVPLESKLAVVVNRSDIVGKPLIQMLLRENATVIACHSKTENLGRLTRMADVLITATGNPGSITADMVKPGAAVVDVGTGQAPDGTLKGDVDVESVGAGGVALKDKIAWLSPVPGGVGPMTRAMLLLNTVKAAEELNCK